MTKVEPVAQAVPQSNGLAPHGRLTVVGWEAPKYELTLEQWADTFRGVSSIQDGIKFARGDLIEYAEKRPWGEKYAQYLDERKDNYQALRDEAWVSRKVHLSLRNDKVSWTHHRHVAKLDKPEEQGYWLNRAMSASWGERELRQAIRQEKSAETRVALTEAEVAQVVYADPPWEYNFSETEARVIEDKEGKATAKGGERKDKKYDPMPLDEIKDMWRDIPIAEDAVLFLWATSPKLDEAIEVVECWGFDYVTCMVWVKDKIGMGYYARQQHELLLIGKRGEPPVPRPENRPPSVMSGPRTEHSRKPELAYIAIERMYPNETKLELFARSERAGWQSWGNEV